MSERRFFKEEEELVLQALRSGELSPYFKNPRGGPMLQQLEKEFAEYVGVEYAVAVDNGSNALLTAYLACGIKPRHRVAVPAHTFIATASMVLAAGATPVFTDVGIASFCMEPEMVPVDDVDAVVPVDLLGHPAPMQDIWDDAKRKKRIVVEDACQALGAEVAGDRVGKFFNHAAVWSGQFTKTWSMGEGGMITTNDRTVYEKALEIRSHGSGYHDVPFLTYNFRATELAAAVGLAQLRRFPSLLVAQQWSAQMFMAGMKRIGFPGEAPGVPEHMQHTWYIMAWKVPKTFNRDRFISYMAANGVNNGVPGQVISKGYTAPLSHKPLFEKYRDDRETPNAILLADRWLWFDVHRFNWGLYNVEKALKAIDAYPRSAEEW